MLASRSSRAALILSIVITAAADRQQSPIDPPPIKGHSCPYNLTQHDCRNNRQCPKEPGFILDHNTAPLLQFMP
jgi:hypothetical protein